MLDILLGLAIFAIIVWLIFFILGQLPLPDPPKTIIAVIIALIVLIVLLNQVGLLEPGRFHLLRR